MFLQPGSVTGQHQESNKLAFYFYASDLAERDFIEARFKKAVEGFGLEVICCEEKDVTSAARRHPHVLPMIEEGAVPLKYCLDIVPFTKGSAVKYFSDYISHQVTEAALQLNVRRPEIKIWACGDSGNDLPLMSAPEVNSVVLVGGSSPELLRASEGLLALGKEVIVESDASRSGPSSISAAIAP
jgi:hydroxymethylpyrimidine pyrophosphatase-like HAD family hydrolase